MSDGALELDPVLHSGPRITIMSRLVIHRRMGFTSLQRSTALTSGNLAAHLAVLAKVGYVAQETQPNSVLRRKSVNITDSGDRAFRDYITAMRRLFAEVEAGPPIP